MGLTLEWSHTLNLGQRTHVMGILNVTPDSFSDGGRYVKVDKAVEHALEMTTGLGGCLLGVWIGNDTAHKEVLSRANRLVLRFPSCPANTIEIEIYGPAVEGADHVVPASTAKRN